MGGARAVRVAMGALLATAAALGAQEPRTGYVPAGPDRLYYEEAGSGDAVLLLHDGLVHGAAMDALFRALAGEYRAIRYDRRGYGRSDTPTERYSPVADGFAVLDHLGVGRAVLLGASAGGGGAIEMALAEPGRVTALVLLGAVVNGHPFSEHFRRRGASNMAPASRGDYRGAMRRWIDDPYLVAPANDDLREPLWDLVAPYAEKHLTNPFDLAEPPERAAAERLPELDVPALIVVGAEDIPDVHAHAGVIEAGIAGAKRVVLEGAGHMLFFERPEEVHRLVREFLAAPREGG